MNKKFLTAVAFIIGNLIANKNTIAQVTVTINTAQNRQSISPLIYGVNYSSANTSGVYTAERLGGDAMSTYNWETNYSTTHWWNSGVYVNDNNDWIPFTLGLNGGSYTPGKAIVTFRNYSNTRHSYPLVQLSCMGLVAKDMSGNINSSQCNAGLSSGRFLTSQVLKGSALSLTPNLSDNFVYTDEELNFLINQCGSASTSNGIKGYCIDNEPGGWNSTHPCNHKNPATCTEVLTKNISLAQQIKTLDPTAEVFGPELMNYTDYTQLVYPAPTDWNSYNMTDTTYNPADFNYNTFACSYLRRMKNASNAFGKRLLDVFSIHFYREGASLLQDSRSLWDATYVENSWITNSVIVNTPINLLPNFNKCIQHFYPGTKLAITEYGNFDAATSSTNIGTGIYTADVLGAFGKNSVYMGNYFNEPSGYVLGAFNIFRNYNGHNETFGSISVESQSTDNSKVTAYASVNNTINDTLHVIIINRNTSSRAVTLQMSSSANYSGAQVYAMENAASGALVAKPDIANIVGNQLVYTVPAKSVYHLIFYSPKICINPPSVVITNSNPEICTGKTALLLSTNIVGATYAWTGPNGFASNSRNTTIIKIQPAASGIYNLSVTTTKGCLVKASTSITVNPLPIVNASNAGPYCIGDSITVQAASGSLLYNWSYTENGMTFPQSKTTNTYTTVGIKDTAIRSRVYTVSVTDNKGCIAKGTTIAKLYSPRYVTASYTITTLMAGKKINLMVTNVTGATYLWNGPNGFVSTLRLPYILNATTANNGIYHVLVTTANNCVFRSDVNVTVAVLKMIKESEPFSNENSDIIQIFPSPSPSGIFNILFKKGLTMQWEIISLNGSQILKGNTNDHSKTIDLSSYSNGVYLLRTHYGLKTYDVKLVK